MTNRRDRRASKAGRARGYEISDINGDTRRVLDALVACWIEDTPAGRAMLEGGLSVEQAREALYGLVGRGYATIRVLEGEAPARRVGIEILPIMPSAGPKP